MILLNIRNINSIRTFANKVDRNEAISVLFDLNKLKIQTVNVHEGIDDIDYPPKLSFGLDRVLFNPGIFTLRDKRTNVYNFDEYLRDILQPDMFDYSLLNVFKSAAKDIKLHRIGKAIGAKFVSSTSSITSIMQQLYLLISENRPPNLNNFSREFDNEAKGFANALKDPISFILEPHENDIRSIVLESYEDDDLSILKKLGCSLEKLLTLTKEQFERLKKGVQYPYKPTSEVFQFTKAGPLLLRSQLDCYDSRLPRRTFDLKTRAVHPIRMDLEHYKDFIGYKIKYLHGFYESYEREQYDLIRAAMLRYNFQVRIGDMDGIFVTYHNTQEIFGFQYMSREELDTILYGSSEFGDAAYNHVIQAVAWLVMHICKQYQSNDVIRVTFSQSGANLSKCRWDQDTKLRIYCEAITDPIEPLTKIQSTLNIFDVKFQSFLRSDTTFISPLLINQKNINDWMVCAQIDDVHVNATREKEFETIRASILRKAGVLDGSKRSRYRSTAIKRLISLSNDDTNTPILGGYWTKITDKSNGYRYGSIPSIYPLDTIDHPVYRNIICHQRS